MRLAGFFLSMEVVESINFPESTSRFCSVHSKLRSGRGVNSSGVGRTPFGRAIVFTGLDQEEKREGLPVRKEPKSLQIRIFKECLRIGLCSRFVMLGKAGKDGSRVGAFWEVKIVGRWRA